MIIIDRLVNRIKSEIELRRSIKVLKEVHLYLSNKGVQMLYVILPQKERIKGLTPFELERLHNWSFDFNKYKEELPKLKKIYGEDVTAEYINSVFDGGIVVQGEHRKILLDYEGSNQHIINGRRITIGQPLHYHNTIYTHGACTWRGTGVEDRETIASYLQGLINSDYPNSYRVVNSAIGRGSNINDDFEFIKEQSYKCGDIVVVGSHGPMLTLPYSFFDKNRIPYIETSSCFNRPHDYGEWFNDSLLHTNKRGNCVLASAIYEYLQKHNWFDTSKLKVEKQESENIIDITKGQRIYGDNPQLLEYISTIKNYCKGNSDTRNGSIVMNCNPFTLGHRYLVEYASKAVETLYIFVVEENKSYFSFEDRFELVKKGVADLDNVIVLPSGNFIISAVTFPGYFYKDNLKDTKIDCSNDLMIFAQYIAPALNIKIRFAGEEPLDPVTNQYNEGMKEILPRYGIEFHPIPRILDDGNSEVISASRVRRYYENGCLEEIKTLVPATTYEYLFRRYLREHADDQG